jgi:hypothetical protein
MSNAGAQQPPTPLSGDRKWKEVTNGVAERNAAAQKTGKLERDARELRAAKRRKAEQDAAAPESGWR